MFKMDHVSVDEERNLAAACSEHDDEETDRPDR
jgi:hypothetical protein